MGGFKAIRTLPGATPRTNQHPFACPTAKNSRILIMLNLAICLAQIPKLSWQYWQTYSQSTRHLFRWRSEVG